MKRALLALATVAAVLSACDDAEDIIGLEPLVGRRIYAVDLDNNLILFGSGSTGIVSNSTPISGLLAGELVIGIDFRPTFAPGSDSTKVGALYGLTSESRLVIIDTATAVATVVGALDMGGAAFAITGAFVGVDFNPTVDRIRVHTDLRQNLRINPNTGEVIVDSDLAFVTGDANETAAASIVANAYTFGVFGGTTSLLAIDSGVDVIALSANPNAGFLATITALPIDAGGNSSFDIASDGTAVAALAGPAAASSSIYTISGLPASATFTLIGSADRVLRGLAIAP